jgi:hypothetical protein
MSKDRRDHIRPKTSQHMFIVAGLPRVVHQRTLRQLQDENPQLIFKGAPSPDDGNLYPPGLVESLVKSVGTFVVRRRQASKEELTPASIVLLYVPSYDQERLLEVFDFAVMTQDLPGLAPWENGRQRRHDLDVVRDELTAAIQASASARTNLNTVQERLNRQVDNEPLLLPPRNFFTQAGDLAPVLRQFRTGPRTWTDRLADYGPKVLTHDDVPNRISPQQTRRPFVDSRGMAFFTAHPAAYDGPPREVDDGDDAASILAALRSLYRFGGALARGLHHDVQRDDGTPLGGAEFHCSEKGSITSTSDYANIYPNDFVRVDQHTQVG